MTALSRSSSRLRSVARDEMHLPPAMLAEPPTEIPEREPLLYSTGSSVFIWQLVPAATVFYLAGPLAQERLEFDEAAKGAASYSASGLLSPSSTCASQKI
ncbi:hypothetical protein NMY22_g2528 [Coprinellus aureogranulatus]|nr:hypothetical protein NMY22_g2528 [Coprinellus aureogranulatus]